MCCTEEGTTFTVVAGLRSVEGARLQRPCCARHYRLVGEQEALGGLRSLPVCIFDMAVEGRGIGLGYLPGPSQGSPWPPFVTRAISGGGLKGSSTGMVGRPLAGTPPAGWAGSTSGVPTCGSLTCS